MDLDECKRSKRVVCCRGPPIPSTNINVPYFYTLTQQNTNVNNYGKSIAFNGTGTILVVASDSGIYFYSYVNGQYEELRVVNVNPLTAIAVSQEGFAAKNDLTGVITVGYIKDNKLVILGYQYDGYVFGTQVIAQNIGYPTQLSVNGNGSVFAYYNNIKKSVQYTYFHKGWRSVTGGFLASNVIDMSLASGSCYPNGQLAVLCSNNTVYYYPQLDKEPVRLNTAGVTKVVLSGNGQLLFFVDSVSKLLYIYKFNGRYLVLTQQIGLNLPGGE